MEDVISLAERFFQAIERGDVATVRSIYAPDAVIWHNFDPLDARSTGQSVEDNLKVLEQLPQRISGARYQVVQREATQTGFVQQHVLTGTMRNGEAFVLPACIICQVEDGRISRLDEYFDPAITTRLLQVTAQAAGQPVRS